MAENNKKIVRRSCEYWTNERHVHFLNSMEASFVRSMFFQNQSNVNAAATRLDRYLPDTSDSTEDLPRERRRRHSTSDIVESSSGTRTEKKTKKLSSHKSSQDQVVPQFQKKRDDKDKDAKDHAS